MDYKPLVAKSGEVFFTVSGNLQMLPSMEEYQAMIDHKKKLENTYFEILVDNIYHKLLVSRKDVIMNLIFNLPIHQQNEQLQKYQALCEEVGL